MPPFRCVALVCLAIVLPAAADSQLLYRYDDDINILSPVWSSRAGADHLALGRAGIASRGLSGSVLINPALQTAAGWQIEADAAWMPTADGLLQYTHQRSAVIPVHATVTFPLDGLTCSVGAIRSHHEQSESSEILITTQQNPEGTGETFRMTTTSAVHTFFVSVASEMSPGLAFGLTVAIDDVADESTLWRTWYRSHGTSVRAVGGVWYEVSEHATVGGAVRYAVPAKLAGRTNSPLVSGGARMPDPQRVARWPLEAEVGTTIEWLPTVRFLAALQFSDWTSAFSNASDRWDFRLGLEAEVAGISLRAGTYSQGMPVAVTSAYYDQQFLTVGISGRWSEHIECSAAFATSTPFVRSNVPTILGTTGESFHRSELVAGLVVAL